MSGKIASQTKYTYDKCGNIERVYTDGRESARYHYDGINRLIREDNKLFNQTYTYTYDSGGNILSKAIYDYLIEQNLDGVEAIKSHDYSYNMEGWRDQLIGYDGESFVYDEIGNPTTYRGKIATWKYGRQLASLCNTTYTYNASGLRKSKTVSGVLTQYLWDGSNLLGQYDGINELLYRYGADGICGVNHIGVEYTYIKNIQGDVTHILDSSSNIVGRYIYDAWGNHKAYTVVDGVESLVYDSSSNTNLSNIAINSIVSLNPIRYRSYYYDQETGLFYTPGRYYDPEIGRWINADDISYLEPETIGGLNLYAYCLNNPISYYDPTGNFVISIFLICLGIGIAGGAALGGYTAVQKGAELWSKDFWIGVGTGALIGGAVGAVAGLGGAFLAGGLSSLAGKFVADAASSLMFGTNNFGTWEDYAIAFVMGGLLKGLPLGKLGSIGKGVAKFAGDVALRPALNQFAKMGTRGAEFDLNNYLYTVVIRAATFNIGFGNVKFGMLGSEFSLSLGKSIMRGFLSGFRKNI